MSQFKSIDEAIYTIDGSNIVARKKNPTLSIVVILVGAAFLAAMEYTHSVKANKELASGLLLVGILVVLVGLIMLILNVTHKGTPFYIPAGEHLRRRQRSFDQNVKDQVVKLLTEGDIAAIDDMPEGETGAIFVTTYRSRHNKVVFGQVQEFVPHYYVPITDVLVFKK